MVKDKEYIVDKQTFRLYEESINKLLSFYKAIATIKINDDLIKIKEEKNKIFKNNFKKYIDNIEEKEFNEQTSIEKQLSKSIMNFNFELMIQSLDDKIIKFLEKPLKESKIKIDKKVKTLFNNNKEFIKEIIPKELNDLFSKLKEYDEELNRKITIQQFKEIKENEIKTIDNISNTLALFIVNEIYQNSTLKELFIEYSMIKKEPFINDLKNELINNPLLNNLQKEHKKLIKILLKDIPKEYISKFYSLNDEYFTEKTINKNKKLINNYQTLTDSLNKLNESLNINLINKLINTIKITSQNNSLRWISLFKELIINFTNLNIIIKEEEKEDYKIIKENINEEVIKAEYSHWTIPYEGLIELHYLLNNKPSIAKIVYRAKRNQFSIGSFQADFEDLDWKAKISEPITRYHKLNRNEIKMYWSDKNS